MSHRLFRRLAHPYSSNCTASWEETPYSGLGAAEGTVYTLEVDTSNI